MNNEHFSERLYYADNSSATACHNGNISAARMAQADTAFTFYYYYDLQNRLIESKREHRGIKKPCECFEYNKRGNITKIQRYDVAKLRDNLTLTYQDDGNRPISIEDEGQDSYTNSHIEYYDYHDATTNDPDMLYDANGNLIYDADRGISVIHYNILNLPDTIQFINGNQIVNLYDAAGRKYKSVVFTVPPTAVAPQYEIVHYPYGVDSLSYLITDYAGNIETVYTDEDTLTRRIHNSIGYNADGVYYHYIKDHLGNICAVVNSETNNPIQSTIYYASGVPMPMSSGMDEQPYLYNGKEFVTAHELNTYDYGFRGYFATIGRFTTMDPLAEQTPWQSPYSYAGNRFVNAIDWMGLGGMTGYTHENNLIAVNEDGVVVYSDLYSDDLRVIEVSNEWTEEDGFDKYLRLLGLHYYGYKGAIQDASGRFDPRCLQFYTSQLPTVTCIAPALSEFQIAIQHSERAMEISSWIVDAGSNVKCNELWWIGKNKQVYFKFQRTHGQGWWVYNNSYEIAKQSIKGVKFLGRFIGVASAAIETTGVIYEGEIKPSDAINTALVAFAVSGYASWVPLVYCTADIITEQMTGVSLTTRADLYWGTIYKW